MGDGFYRSKDPTNSIKVLKEEAVARIHRSLSWVWMHHNQFSSSSTLLWYHYDTGRSVYCCKDRRISSRLIGATHWRVISIHNHAGLMKPRGHRWRRGTARLNTPHQPLSAVSHSLTHWAAARRDRQPPPLHRTALHCGLNTSRDWIYTWSSVTQQHRGCRRV